MINSEAAEPRNEALCVEFKPTLGHRLRRWLGFRRHLGEEPEGTEQMKWAQTNVHLGFGLVDRLRLLATGRLRVILTTYTSEDFMTVKTRMDWGIDGPGERWGQ